jgi:hypothetical protein
MYPLPFNAIVKGTLSFPYFGGNGTTFEFSCGAGGEIRFSPSFAGICGNVSACYMIGNGVLTPGSQFPDCAEGTVDCGIPIVKTERESVKSLPCLTVETGNVTISGVMSNESDSNSLVQRSSNSTEAKAVGFRIEGAGLLTAKTTTRPDYVMSMSDKALALCTGLLGITRCGIEPLSQTTLTFGVCSIVSKECTTRVPPDTLPYYTPHIVPFSPFHFGTHHIHFLYTEDVPGRHMHMQRSRRACQGCRKTDRPGFEPLNVTGALRV